MSRKIAHRVHRELYLSAMAIEIVTIGLAQDARKALRRRVQHTTLYHVYSRSREVMGL